DALHDDPVLQRPDLHCHCPTLLLESPKFAECNGNSGGVGCFSAQRPNSFGGAKLTTWPALSRRPTRVMPSASRAPPRSSADTARPTRGSRGRPASAGGTGRGGRAPRRGRIRRSAPSSPPPGTGGRSAPSRGSPPSPPSGWRARGTTGGARRGSQREPLRLGDPLLHQPPDAPEGEGLAAGA